MGSTKIESSLITNETLFELKNGNKLKLCSELFLFLQETKVPWKILGEPLKNFIEKVIFSIPPKDRIKGAISSNAYLENKELIVICEGAIVEAGAYIAGPTFIGAHAVIRHGAYVRGSVYISEGAIVGHTTECKGSLFLPFAKAAHFNYVGDSILGHECNLGAGTKLANLKMSHSNVVLYFSDRKIDTKLKKFGAILGNRSQTGCNSVTNPGTILLPEAILLPNQTALGVIDVP